jgi:hypothetical protein
VHAGSGTATFHTGEEAHTFGPYRPNGYEEEWRYLADLATGAAEPLDAQVFVDDLEFALTIAELATAEVRKNVEKAEALA